MLSQRAWAAILFLNVVFIVSRTSLCTFGRKRYTYIGEDYPMRLPIKLDPVQARFDCSARYSINGSTAGDVWTKSTDTQSGGMIRLGPDRRVFAIAMYHQLHCLEGLRTSLATPNRTEAHDGHFGHCLNYLRQVFECTADATEEPVVKISTLTSQGCAPAFIRQCFNWNTLYEYISGNYLAFHEFKATNGSWSCTGKEYLEHKKGSPHGPAQAHLCALSAHGFVDSHAHEH